ncbi:MAG: hypothetical protein V1794_07740 [Candidatus Glassbacteria bacterium]
MNFSEIEKEVIYLRAVKEIVDSMVNYEVLNLIGNDPDSEIRFKSSIHQKFFNIILVDFFSSPGKKFIIKQQPYLEILFLICQKPNFNENGSINNLVLSVEEFKNWLEQEIKEEIWLPSIEMNGVLSLKRIEFLKICGNISKHNFTRLSIAVKQLEQIFKRNKLSIDCEDALLILDEFYEIYHTDIFNYLGSTIAEFLNNIRWGIYYYLQPEFSRSIKWESGDPPKYKYTYPKGLINKFAKSCYLKLMNEVRSEPYMRKFKVTEILKLRY